MSWRKVHFWLGLVVVAQVFLWIVSGIGFALLPDAELQGRADSRQLSEPPLAAEAATVSLPELAAAIQRQIGKTPDIKKVTLSRRAPGNDLLYQVTLRDESSPRLFDAGSGEIVPPVSESQAIIIAREDFIGAGDVTGVEWITEPYQQGFEYNGPFPAYRIDFSNWKHTRIYVSPYTGQVLARRNVHRTMRDVFWTVHVFGYLDNEVRGNVPILVSGTVSLVAVMSGILLLVPYLRRRVARSAVTSRAPVMAAAQTGAD